MSFISGAPLTNGSSSFFGVAVSSGWSPLQPNPTHHAPRNGSCACEHAFMTSHAPFHFDIYVSHSTSFFLSGMETWRRCNLSLYSPYFIFTVVYMKKII